MSLARYQQKRDFRVTPEPRGRVARGRARELAFVIQKHAASHLHYDFRLELNGVLLSWAVPKGPSFDPADKRLAMHVEDHPLEYGGFEGTIPAGQYGGGTVMLWDRGNWIPHGDPAEGYATGRLKFELDGGKLKGGWMLVRSQPGKFGGKYGGKRAGDVWFLIKEKDSYAHAGDPVVDTAPNSVTSGRSLDEIAKDEDRIWRSDKSVKENVRAGAVEPPSKAKSKPATVKVAAPAGARRARLPTTLAPMLATLVKSTPAGEGWLHEIKYDGYRMLARIERGKARIFSRNGKDWTTALRPIATALASLPLTSGWLDGEIAITDAKGRTSFQRLQNALASPAAQDITFFAFDLPFADGFDLRQVPLRERKAMLRALLDPPPEHVRYGVEIEAEGAQVFAQACSLGLEGIVSKRLDATYQAVRSRDWLKVKCGRRQEMVVGGYSEPQGGRAGFGALLLGVYDDAHALHYSGRVGTGFDDDTLNALYARLSKLEVDTPAFADPPRGYAAKGVHWVKPQLVAEIAFTEWTDVGTMRHPSFQGLRMDKKASDVKREREAEPPGTKEVDSASHSRRKGAAASTGAARKRAPTTAVTKRAVTSAATTRRARASASSKPPATKAVTKSAVAPAHTAATPGEGDVLEGVRISHPDKLYFADAKITKRDVASYYEAVAPRMLPHIERRPLALLRCPDGWKGECFYQKHAAAALHEAVGRIEVPESKGTATYSEVHSAAGLVGLVQWGVLEIHPWGSRAPKLDRPDRLIFDFDPDDAVKWKTLVESVGMLRKLLDELGLPAFIKTTGGKGLHVVAPVRPTVDWQTAKAFTRAVAELMVKTFPERFVSTVSKARRKDKIFIDYLRNAEGATAIAPYAVRARANAPVATPIEWDEIANGTDIRFDHFNLRNTPERLAAQGKDPWQDLEKAATTLTAAMRKRVGAR
jgi:bifunctional non-homologous end joining protein LigD